MFKLTTFFLFFMCLICVSSYANGQHYHQNNYTRNDGINSVKYRLQKREYRRDLNERIGKSPLYQRKKINQKIFRGYDPFKETHNHNFHYITPTYTWRDYFGNYWYY